MTEIHEAGEKARDAARKALEIAAPMELEVWESARNATYKAVAFLNMVTAQVRSLENSSHTQTAHRKNKWRLAEESAKLASATAVKAERDAESKLNDVAGEAFKAWKEMEDAYKNAFHAH